MNNGDVYHMKPDELLRLFRLGTDYLQKRERETPGLSVIPGQMWDDLAKLIGIEYYIRSTNDAGEEIHVFYIVDRDKFIIYKLCGNDDDYSL